MKMLILVGIVGLCGAVGFGLSGYYLERKRFFFNLKNFLCSLKNEISFSLMKLVDVVEKLNGQVKDKCLEKILSNYVNVLKNKHEINVNDLFQNVEILNEQEKESICLFFKRLGRIDLSNQINEIDNYINIFDENYSLAKLEADKYCSFYTKMGLLIGLFVAVIFA